VVEAEFELDRHDKSAVSALSAVLADCRYYRAIKPNNKAIRTTRKGSEVRVLYGPLGRCFLVGLRRWFIPLVCTRS